MPNAKAMEDELCCFKKIKDIFYFASIKKSNTTRNKVETQPVLTWGARGAGRGVRGGVVCKELEVKAKVVLIYHLILLKDSRPSLKKNGSDKHCCYRYVRPTLFFLSLSMWLVNVEVYDCRLMVNSFCFSSTNVLADDYSFNVWIWKYYETYGFELAVPYKRI